VAFAPYANPRADGPPTLRVHCGALAQSSLTHRDQADCYGMKRVGTVVLAGLALSAPVASAHLRGVVVPLSLSQVRTPQVPSRCVSTSGAYPRVSGVGFNLKAVNGSLRRAVLNDEQAFSHPLKCPLGDKPKGVYETAPTRSLISASSDVVSALVPVLSLLPGGNDGATWLSVTVLVPSGRVVTFRDLVAAEHRRLAALGALVRSRAIRESVCVRNALKDPILGPSFANALRASYSENFALTSQGLAIGFANGTVTGPACGRIEVTVPYDLARPYLTPLGEQLTLSVRQPR
jgi:hypothetical protein